ncbi:pentapeptide repeat-containing protein [Streptomyces phaeolivaceus]|uniref:Pentapeptide repeat-containing protein n=2 Tax=Streptomyces phaeolivaceus TaxID=2653200 RepID=A0A5P8KGY2_9ACTN|nr:pentapeptide repeat-containing protein [Streptomyces phaeolivaceus]
MSSGTRRNWAPRALPADPQATARLREWLQSGAEGKLDVIGLDLSNSDLSGGNFSESWFSDAKLVGAKLAGADFYRSDAEGADFSGADLTQASLVRVNFDDAVLRGTVLDGADLVKASLYDVDATAASLRGARILGASLIGVDFRGADLSHAVLQENSFKVTVDHLTKVEGLSGTVFGPVQAMDDQGVSREIGGAELERWVSERGGSLQVLPVPGGTRDA